MMKETDLSKILTHFSNFKIKTAKIRVKISSSMNNLQKSLEIATQKIKNNS